MTSCPSLRQTRWQPESWPHASGREFPGFVILPRLGNRHPVKESLARLLKLYGHLFYPGRNDHQISLDPPCRRLVAKSLSITPSTPTRLPSSSTTGMPPPPQQITTSPKSTTLLDHPLFNDLLGNGGGNQRRYPRPASSTTAPPSLSTIGCILSFVRKDPRAWSVFERPGPFGRRGTG